jgi:hypothetical protein
MRRQRGECDFRRCWYDALEPKWLRILSCHHRLLLLLLLLIFLLVLLLLPTVAGREFHYVDLVHFEQIFFNV